MFERYLTDAVASHFGHVVENLDADKVRLSAWSGELVLKDLKLRNNALDAFLKDSPVEIVYGKVGNLELRIPWTLFRSQLRWRKESNQLRLLSTRCSIVLSDVNILIAPKSQSQTQNSRKDDEETAEELRKEKEKIVQSMLDANLLRRVTESSVSSARWNWVQDLLSSVLSTLSVTVRNIHVRYEDPGTCMGFVWKSDSLGSTHTSKTYRPAFGGGHYIASVFCRLE